MFEVKICEKGRFFILGLSVHLYISSNLSLLNAYKWAFVLVGFCPSGLLSQWAFVQWAFVLVGFCPSGLLSYTLDKLHCLLVFIDCLLV